MLFLSALQASTNKFNYRAPEIFYFTVPLLLACDNIYYILTVIKLLKGLSQENLRQRQSKNVITLFGQCLCFIIEITISITLYAAQIDFPAFQFTSGLHTAAIFLSSPELMRFYFKGG